MKILIISNNQKWKSWSKKIQDIKDWFKPAVDLEFTLGPVDFKKIPFVPVDNGKEIDPKWYDENILPLANGYDIVMFSVPLKQWKGGNIRGRWTRGAIHKIQLGANETGDYEYNKIKHEGGRWFNIARHELCHAISAILKIQDRTHYWWELGTLTEILKEFANKPTSPINHMEIAISQAGVTEFVGRESNPIILNWAKECGIPYYEDGISWCSLYVNWVAFKSKLPMSKKLNARSWLDVGKRVTTPRTGDVCVFWRESVDSWMGHVGFYISENSTSVQVWGGNQGDKVCLASYPKSRLLGFVRLN
jgi:uncharacterized protein (TIGR02594 family)